MAARMGPSDFFYPTTKKSNQDVEPSDDDDDDNRKKERSDGGAADLHTDRDCWPMSKDKGVPAGDVRGCEDVVGLGRRKDRGGVGGAGGGLSGGRPFRVAAPLCLARRSSARMPGGISRSAPATRGLASKRDDPRACRLLKNGASMTSARARMHSLFGDARAAPTLAARVACRPTGPGGGETFSDHVGL